MLNHLETDCKIVFLLGAGFSNAITNGKAPLTTELGDKLENLFPDEMKQRFNFAPDNIESFFTKIDLEVLHLKQLKQDSSELVEIRRKASREIVDIFATKKLFCMENGKIKISDSANRICGMLFQKNDTILTLNYDCTLENVLLAQDKWSMQGGWGKYFSFIQDTENRERKLNIEILKLHGSINFVLVASLDGNNFDYSKLRLEWCVDKELFPNGRENTSWQGEIREYIILPSYLKLFDKKILNLWKEAVLRIREANKVVIIGCAMREEDYLLRFLISFINQTAKIIIIEPFGNRIKDKLIKTAPVNSPNVESINTKIEDITDDIVKNIYNS